MAAGRGRLGLALSGGGHRAALFHIGVLARLAELSQLKDVRVISTVSGGSIVGALYYLLLRRRLEAMRDSQITPATYVEIVEELERAYRGAVRRSFRGLSLTSPRVAKLVLPTYSRTNLIAEVCERELYRDAAGASGPVAMSQLLVAPLDDEGRRLGGFKPLGPENDARNAPVPVLVVNSTALNTGHSFRFEAEYVGEPTAASPLERDADKNTRLVRVRYDELGDARLARRFTLGFAVSASAAFPVGFAPLALKGMFGRSASGELSPYLVRLSDGGVRDNQGIDGLLDNGCTRLIVSDGSGQMPDLGEGPGAIPGVLGRVISIGSKESREQRVYRAFVDAGVQIAFVHLQTGLVPGELWPERSPADAGAGEQFASPYRTGLDAQAQEAVARIRTDLDAFSDVECSALEEVGYRACDAAMELNPLFDPAPPAAPFGTRWRFAAVRGRLEAGDDPRLLRRLRVGRLTFFKPVALLASRLDRAVERIRPWRRIRAALGYGLLGSAAVLGLVEGGLAVHGSVPALALYAGCLGAGFVVLLYAAADTPGLRLLSRVALGALTAPLLPLLYLGGWAMRLMSRLHVAAGGDGWAGGPG